jgi:hypothetical protein
VSQAARLVIPSGARNLPIESVVTPITLCDAGSDVRSFASLRMTRHEEIALEFVGAMRAENEFELKENRIHVASGKEECVVDKVVVVLQPDL